MCLSSYERCTLKFAGLIALALYLFSLYLALAASYLIIGKKVSVGKRDHGYETKRLRVELMLFSNFFKDFRVNTPVTFNKNLSSTLLLIFSKFFVTFSFLCKTNFVL